MSSNENGNHPAYQHILDALPESLHSVILPELKKWDAGVTQKFQEIHSQYEPLKKYQEFVERGIDPEYASQAVILADQLQQDPKSLVARINDTWKLGFVPEDEAKAVRSNDDELDLSEYTDGDTDPLKHPKIKEMYENLQRVQNEWDSRKQEEEEEAQVAEFEAYLDELEKTVTEKNLPFNRMFVTALMQQGTDGEEAVKQYHQVLAGNAVTPSQEQDATKTSDNPPVIMGGDGSTGSGTPDNPVNFGALSKNDLNSTIEQILANAQNSGQ